MSEEIGLFEAMYTQRAIRHYKLDPVPDELIRKLIEAASKAPSGANSQRWHFVGIRDADTKRRIGSYYSRSWHAADGSPDSPRDANHMGSVLPNPQERFAQLEAEDASRRLTVPSSFFSGVPRIATRPPESFFSSDATGSWIRKREPEPFLLVTSIDPPSRSRSLRVNARPIPIPSYARERRESSCDSASNISGINSSQIPMPVS